MQHDDRKNNPLIDDLVNIVGDSHVLTAPHKTERYRRGFRSGEGDALAVIFPGTLLELWLVVNAVAAADRIIIMQAANTGLTGGSTPDENDYDRDIIIINTLRLDQIQILSTQNQIIAFPGSTLWQLEKILKPLNREPHSVIGSSCIGASVIGGICNNSGGALVQRGPAYTELALYAKINDSGEVELINHLGISLGDTPETILSNLENHQYTDGDIQENTKSASDHDYQTRIRDVDANTPARFNANQEKLFEASGCAGKLIVFAVRLDTFASPGKQQVFYIGANNPDELEDIRRHMLANFKHLPIAGEYMHRECYDIAKAYGKDSFLIIDKFGTAIMPKLFTIKGRIDAVLNKIPFIPKYTIDRVMQGLSHLWPSHLPKRMENYRNQYEHHLMLKMAGEGIEEARIWLTEFFKTAEGNFFECNDKEGADAFLHRFAAAGAAIRYQTVHQSKTEDILALDIALRRNDYQWLEVLPSHIEDKLLHKLYYGHFMCHVFHQDYIIKKGVDVDALKKEMLLLLNEREAEYPAEHNVGHVYKAKPQLKQFYQQLDPTNSLNPGLGKTSKLKYWQTKKQFEEENNKLG